MATTWNGFDALDGGGSGRSGWAVRILRFWKFVSRQRAETADAPVRFAMFHETPQPASQPLWRRISAAIAQMELTDGSASFQRETATAVVEPAMKSGATSNVEGALDPDAPPVGLLDLIEASVDEIRSPPSGHRRPPRRSPRR